jgi:hypothetical protein
MNAKENDFRAKTKLFKEPAAGKSRCYREGTSPAKNRGTFAYEQSE